MYSSGSTGGSTLSQFAAYWVLLYQLFLLRSARLSLCCTAQQGPVAGTWRSEPGTRWSSRTGPGEAQTQLERNLKKVKMKILESCLIRSTNFPMGQAC